jgi:hypothetical protein
MSSRRTFVAAGIATAVLSTLASSPAAASTARVRGVYTAGARRGHQRANLRGSQLSAFDLRHPDLRDAHMRCDIALGERAALTDVGQPCRTDRGE